MQVDLHQSDQAMLEVEHACDARLYNDSTCCTAYCVGRHSEPKHTGELKISNHTAQQAVVWWGQLASLLHNLEQ